MILNCYEAGKNENYIYRKKGSRLVAVYVDGGREKFFIADMDGQRVWDKTNYCVYRVKGSPYSQKNADVEHIEYAYTVIHAKKIIMDFCKNEKFEEDRRESNVAYLPDGDNKDFYPTPDKLAGKLFGIIEWKGVLEVLEPSAGKGDLVDAMYKMAWCHRYSIEIRGACMGNVDGTDVIELDYNLRLILRGKGYRLVGDDFLKLHSNKKYDLILMNPPFSNGARHLIHAIEMQKDGGKIACILNAETIRNPYTNERKMLKSLLAKYAARIEFVKDGFKNAQRRTGVEVALVYIDIPRKANDYSSFFEGAKKAVEKDYSELHEQNTQLVIADDILSLIEYFNVEAKAGVDLMLAYEAIVPNIMSGKGDYEKPLLQMSVGETKFTKASNEMINEYLKNLRYKYWRLLLNKPQLQEKMTSKMQDDFSAKLREMSEYEFDKHNVMQVFFDIQMQLQQGVEDSIMALFSKLSEEYSWSREIQSDNIHYYNGWATNKAWKVGMKVILPINGFSSYSWDADKLDTYDIPKTISDMERAMMYLDKGEIGWQRDPWSVISNANDLKATRGELAFTYFTAKFYKKGTCHIKFRPEAAPIIDRLNIFAARKRSWLPPSYGRKKYEDMSEKEKAVIDDFQGKDDYEKVMQNPSKYVIEASQLRPMLTE